MSLTPSEFVMPSNWTTTGEVRKPVYGSLQGQHARFEDVKIYDAGESKIRGKEVYRTREVCYIKNDKFSTAALHVGGVELVTNPADPNGPKVETMLRSDMNYEQRAKLGPLYERFVSQKGSKETHIYDWEAIGETEKKILAENGVMTVEQLSELKKEEMYKFGPLAKELQEKANQHIRMKKEDSGEEEKERLLLVAEENRQLRERAAEAERKYLESQAEIARLQQAKRGPGRPLKIEGTETEA